MHFPVIRLRGTGFAHPADDAGVVLAGGEFRRASSSSKNGRLFFGPTMLKSATAALARSSTCCRSSPYTINFAIKES